MSSPHFKVGDLVTPSKAARAADWWSKVRYLDFAELLVLRVEQAKYTSGFVVYFHDPRYGERRWHERNFRKVALSLENE